MRLLGCSATTSRGSTPATGSSQTRQDPHRDGPAAAQFNLGLLKCSLGGGIALITRGGSLDSSKPLLIMLT